MTDRLARREMIAMAGSAISLTLAGCSAGGSDGPFESTLSSPQTFENPAEFNNEQYIYVNLTLEGNPDEWPEFSVLGSTYHGYQLKIAEDEGNIQDATILYEDEDLGWRTTDSWVLERGEFENDGEEEERVVLGRPADLQSNTEYTIYLHNPETSENQKIGTVTYDPDS